MNRSIMNRSVTIVVCYEQVYLERTPTMRHIENVENLLTLRLFFQERKLPSALYANKSLFLLAKLLEMKQARKKSK